MSTPENNKGPSTKHKVIAGAIAVAIVYMVYSHFTGGHHHVVADAAKSAVVAAGDKAATKIADAKAKHDEKKAEVSEANAAETAQRGINSTGSTNNQLHGVDDGKTIAINNLAIHDDQADLMLFNAAVAGDRDQAKHMVDQGVKLDFTDNASCLYDFGPMAQLPTVADKMPTNTAEMEHYITFTEMNHRLDERFLVLPTVCSKLSLFASVYKIQKSDQRETFYYFHNDDSINATKSADVSAKMKTQNEAAMDVEERKDQMFKYLLGLTPAKDSDELVAVFVDDKIPFNLRMLALNKYLDNYGQPKSDNVQKYLKLHSDAMADMMKNQPGQPQLEALNDQYTYIWGPVLKLLFNEYHTDLNEYYSIVQSLQTRAKYDKTLANKEIPDIAVADWDHDGISYQENPNSALWQGDLNGKQAFKTLYELNGILKLINAIINSGKLDLNHQDAQGNTILHYAVSNLNNDTTNRGTAVLVRYLLNKGADSTLLNKKGLSALEMVEQRQSAVGANPALLAPLMEVSKAFTDKTYK